MKKHYTVENGQEVEVVEMSLWEFCRPYVVTWTYPIVYTAICGAMVVFCLALATLMMDTMLIVGGAKFGAGVLEVMSWCQSFVFGTLKVTAIIIGIMGVSYTVGSAVGAIALAMRKNRKCRKAAKAIGWAAIVIAWPAMMVIDYFKEAHYYWGTLNLVDLLIGRE